MSGRRVLIIQHTSMPSGSAVSGALLVEGLRRAGDEVVLACVYPTPALVSFYRSRGIEPVDAQGISPFPHTTGGWYRLWNPLHIVALVRLLITAPRSVSVAKRLIRAHSPDVVHLNSVTLAPAAFAAHICGVPLVWHVREHVVRGHVGLRRSVLGHMVRTLPDAAVFLSASDRDQLGTCERWHIVPNFFDFDASSCRLPRETAREVLGLATHAEVILFLGGYSIDKGALVLLHALRRLLPQRRGVVLVVANAHQPSPRTSARLARRALPLMGLATPSQRVRAAIQPLQDHVVVLGWRDDIEVLFAAADVVTFPSVTPHFARPIVEAAAMGTPVVASRLGGVTELVVDGVTGVLVPSRDPDALATALGGVLANPAGAAAMAAEAHRRGREMYDCSVGIASILSIYDDILSGHPADCNLVRP